MLPDWMKDESEYIPPEGSSGFAVKTIKSLGSIMSRLKVEDGREGKRSIPAVWKLILLLAYILTVSISQDRTVLMAAGAIAAVLFCIRPGEMIWSVLKPAMIAAILTAVLFIPAVLITPSSLANSLRVVLKLLMSVSMLMLFNRTTQWNNITGALRKLKVPGIFVFTLDITLRYIVMMGNFMTEILTALTLRSVGKNNKKYNTTGGALGVTFIRGTEMNQEMYEAMRCRGFTDDYKGL